MIDEVFSPQALADIRAYRDPLYIATVVFDGLHFLFWVVVLSFGIGRLYGWSAGLSAGFDRRLRRLQEVPVVRVVPAALTRMWGGPGWGAALLFPMAVEFSRKLLFLPAEFYFGFIHERNFGMSTQSLSSYWWDYFKSAVIATVVLAAVAFGMWGLARRLPKWWLILGGAGSIALVFSAAIDPYRARVYYEQAPVPAGEVREAIAALMEKANIGFQDVRVEKTLEKTVRVQAYFAGKGPTRTIVLNDALLNALNTPEILAAVAHEAGHVHERRWLGQLGSTVALFGFLYLVDLLFRLAAKRGWWGISQRADIRTLPLIFFVFWLATAVVTPASAAFSRIKELEADQFGLQLTGDAPAFRRMLIKVARINKMDPDPPWWIVLSGWSHPPIRQRLAAIE